MPLLKGLPFEPGGIPRVLILGSFPSPLSLEAGEYYANPRNQFWNIMEVHLGISKGLPYTEKLAGLKNRNIGLWDVIFSGMLPRTISRTSSITTQRSGW